MPNHKLIKISALKRPIR